MNRPLPIRSTRKGIRLSLVCCSAVLLMVLTACGQKGPLFLPEDPETDAAATEQAAQEGHEPGTEDGDENEDGEGASR